MTPTSKFQSSWYYPTFDDNKSPVQKNITAEDLKHSKENNFILSSPFETSSPHIVPLLISSPPSTNLQGQQEQSVFSKTYFNPFSNNGTTIENNNNNNNVELNDTDDLDDLTHFLSRQLLQDEEEEEDIEQVKDINNKLSTQFLDQNKMMDSSTFSTSWYTNDNTNNKNNNSSTWSSTSTSTSPFSFQKEHQSSLLFGFPSSGSSIYNNNNNKNSDSDNDNDNNNEVDTNDHDNNDDSILITHQGENDREKRWNRFEPYVDESEFDPTIRPTTTSNLLLNDPSSSSSSSLTQQLNQEKEKEKEEEEENSEEKGEQSNQNEDDTIRKVLDHLISIFPNNDKTELLEKLKSCDYDLEKTIERIILSSVKLSSSTSSSSSSEKNKNRKNDNDNNNHTLITQTRSTTPIHQHELHSTIVIKKPPIVSSPVSVPTTTTTIPTVVSVPVSSSKKRQVCRHYLAGECYRKDCWFAHDLDIKPCKFWLQGSCFKGDTCEFAHSVEDIYLVEQVKNNISSSSSSPINNNNNIDSSSSPILHAPTVGDFPIITKSNRKHKKSHNKKKSVKK